MIEAAQVETRALVSPTVFSQAWPTGGESTSHASAEGEAMTEPAEPAKHLTPSQHALEEGEHLMHKSVGFAWLIGMGLAVLVYFNGYAVTNVLMKFPPVRWINTWLKNRMYFDELYYSVFVGVTLGLSKLSATFDKYVVDGIVNGVAAIVRGAAGFIGWHDKTIVDGVVNGAGRVTLEFGNTVRNSDSGRIRLYVTSLVSVIVLALAAVTLAVLALR
jgi:NADH-quinone oxidoreductase subunit L